MLGEIFRTVHTSIEILIWEMFAVLVATYIYLGHSIKNDDKEIERMEEEEELNFFFNNEE